VAARSATSGVRIDVWTDNFGLHRHYEQNGFRHVRTLDLADYPTGALFRRPAIEPRIARGNHGSPMRQPGQLVTRPHDHRSARDDAASYNASVRWPVRVTVLS